MKHVVEASLIVMCKEIVKINKTVDEWVEIESSDMFQNDTYNGGFDGIEEEFCFSVYIDDLEYWFQFSLEEAVKISSGEIISIDVRKADV